MSKNRIEALFHLGREVSPKAPEIDPVITRLFEIAMNSEEVACRSKEAGDRELARQQYADAALRAKTIYEVIKPNSIPEQMLKAEYGDLTLQGLIAAGETNEAVVLADKLAGEAPDNGHFNRVIKRVQLAGPVFSEAFWSRRREAGEAFEAFHHELHTTSLQK